MSTLRTPLVCAAAALVLGACSGDDANPPKLLDTGWFDTTTTTGGEECPNQLVQTVPEAGVSDWYWRDRPSLFFTTDVHEAYEVWLVDGDGNRPDTSLAWDESGLVASLEWDGWMGPSTDYTLFVRDCRGVHEIPFSTSSLGQPLDVDPGSLIGNTYLVDLVGATWVEPPQLAGILALYFNSPVLLSIQYADADRIDLLGALGYVDPESGIIQDPLSPSWNFPVADFTEAPFIDAEAEQIVLQTSDLSGDTIDVPIHEFRFQATVGPDGTTLGGGRVSGMGDTRFLGPVLNDPDNPDAVCDLAAGLGVNCEACPDDGMPYCLFVSAENVDGELVEDLILTEN